MTNCIEQQTTLTSNKADYSKFTKSIFSDEFLSKYKTKQPPWGPIGYVVAKRTYCRIITDAVTGKERKEEWWEVVDRCLSSSLRYSGGAITMAEAEEMFDAIFNLKMTLAGRSWWQLGTSTVEELGGASLDSCQFANLNSIDSLTFAFDALMLGEGVGASVEYHNIKQLPKVKVGVTVTQVNNDTADFIVPDSREGWVELYKLLLEAFLVTGKSFTFSTHLVRKAGLPLKKFGGVSSGPGPLVDGVKYWSQVLRAREGKALRSVDVIDLICISGFVTKSGNVRRSAIIIIMDYNDREGLRVKRFDLGPVPNWRNTANFSVNCSDISKLPLEFWEAYTVAGEPIGLVNLELSKKKGRIKDADSPQDVDGMNPCGEIALKHKEPCNLAEPHLPNIDSPEEFARIAALAFMLCKVNATVPRHVPDTQEIVNKNMRIGVGLTGAMEAPELVNDPAILDMVYKSLDDADKEFSARLSKTLGREIVHSIRKTTMKPSGTNSGLSGVAPGSHQAYSTYYLRAIRISTTDPIVKKCIEAGYKVELEELFDGTLDYKTSVIYFPCKARKEVVPMTAIEQLNFVKYLQTNWADNAVSCSIYYTKENLEDIKAWLIDNYTDNIKSVSFLLKHDHGFKQAPYTAITEEEYLKEVAKLKPLDLTDVTSDGIVDSLECEGGACSTR